MSNVGIGIFVSICLIIGKANSQSCTCAAFDACMSPMETVMNNCKSQCRSSLATSGASACFDQKEAGMKAVKDCMKPCTASRFKRQFGGMGGPPPGGPDGMGMGPGGPGGMGGGPGGHGGGMDHGRDLAGLSGTAETEVKGYKNCIEQCMKNQMTNNGNSDPHACVRQLNCQRPNFNQNCFSQLDPSSFCKCLQGVYGQSVTCQK